MKNFTKIFCVGILITTYSCGFGEWDVTLYQQKIKNSSKVIYEFDAWGGLDSHQTGFVLMDSTETFKVNSARKLPIYYLSDIPNSKQIKSIALKKAINNDSIKLKIIESENIKNSGISIKVDYFERYAGYSNATCLLNKYKFETFKETNDSLYFYGVEKEFGNNIKDTTRVSFQKGNIKLITNDEGKLFRVEISELFKDNATKFKYKKGTLTEKIMNSPVVCIRTYYLIPKNEMNESKFSNYGIYKRVRKSIVPNKK